MLTNERFLLDLFPNRRWFGAKERSIASVEVLDEAPLDEEEPALVLALTRVVFSDGGDAIYQTPLLVSEDGTTRDAFDDVWRLRVLGNLLAHGETIKGFRGAFRFGGPGLDPLAPPGGGSVRSVGAEQSNSSLVLDESVIVKLIRRLEIGPNPELELNRFLTNAGFEHIPAQVGEIFYEGESDGNEIVIDLGIAQTFVAGARDGWDETLAQLRAFYDTISGEEDLDEASAIVEKRAEHSLTQMGDLGAVTARLHVLVGRGDDAEPEMRPEAVDGWDVKDWADRATESLRKLLRSTDLGLGRIDEAVEERMQALQELDDAGMKLRIHGDYHLGQTMIAERGWLILDFEGEPMRTLQERRAKQSPLRDVAGMIRSFNYAASSVLFERGTPGNDEWRRLEPWADAWEEAARERFLHEYLRTSHEGQFLPADRKTLSLMLDAFEIDKALYEVNYELGHRPDWVRIPLRGIEKVIERSEVR